MNPRYSEYEKELVELYQMLKLMAELPKADVSKFLVEYEKKYGKDLAELFASPRELNDLADAEKIGDLTQDEYEKQIADAFEGSEVSLSEAENPLVSHMVYACHALMTNDITKLDAQMLDETCEYLKKNQFSQNVTDSLEFISCYKKEGNQKLHELIDERFKFAYINLRGADLRGVNIKESIKDKTGVNFQDAKVDKRGLLVTKQGFYSGSQKMDKIVNDSPSNQTKPKPGKSNSN